MRFVFQSLLSSPLFIIMLLSVPATIMGMWKVFQKAGKPGWACLIPFYNIIVYLEIIGKPIWWFILFITPYGSAIFMIWSLNILSKSFGQSEGFTLGLVFLHPIFVCVLGFGNYVYLGPGGPAVLFTSAHYARPLQIKQQMV